MTPQIYWLLGWSALDNQNKTNPAKPTLKNCDKMHICPVSVAGERYNTTFSCSWLSLRSDAYWRGALLLFVFFSSISLTKILIFGSGEGEYESQFISVMSTALEKALNAYQLSSSFKRNSSLSLFSLIFCCSLLAVSYPEMGSAGGFRWPL